MLASIRATQRFRLVRFQLDDDGVGTGLCPAARKTRTRPNVERALHYRLDRIIASRARFGRRYAAWPTR